MINQDILSRLCGQLAFEVENSHIYSTIAIECHQKGLHRLGSIFDSQAKEELEHAEKIKEYLKKNLYQFSIPPIPAIEYMPAGSVDGNWLVERLSYILDREKLTTVLLDTIMNLAIDLRDNTSQAFLQWFLEEQVSEEFEAKQRLDIAMTIDNPPLADLVLGE